MANNYSQCTPVEALKASKKEAHALIELLHAGQEETDDPHGYTGEYYENDNQFYMYAEDYENSENLPESFLKELGKLIAKTRRKYWEFGYAFTCDKMRPGEFGGGQFRIHTDGRIEYPEIKWESDNGK